MTEPTRRHDAIALAILGAAVTLFFADVLTGVTSLYIRDIAHYHYPAKHVLREIVLGGEFPHWNPWWGAGQPMAANPQHQVFYPPNWLIFLPSFRVGFHLLVILHVYATAFAMYALLRSFRARPAAAFLGALSWGFGGLLLSYLSLFPFLFSVTWLPLTALFARRLLRSPSWRDFSLASFFFAVQVLLGEPTTVLQTGVLLGMLALATGWRRGGMRAAVRGVAMVGCISIAALLVSAVQTLPAVDHARDSVRVRGFAFTDVTGWSTPPARFGELFYPSFLGHTDDRSQSLYWGAGKYPVRRGPFLYSIYPGLLMTVLACAGLLAGLRGRFLFLALAVLSWILAIGDHTPLWQLLYDSGLARSVRYPEKFILMMIFALVVFGTRALDELLAGNERVRRAALGVAAAATGIAAVFAVLSRTPAHAQLFVRWWQPSAEAAPAMLTAAAAGWLLAAVRGGAMLLLVRHAATARRRGWVIAAATFVLLDLAPIAFEVVPRTQPGAYDPPLVARQLPGDRDSWRLFHHASWHTQRDAVRPYLAVHPDRFWVLRNAMFPLTPATHGIRMALDIDYDYTALVPTADFAQSVRELSDLRPDWADVAASMSNVWFRAVFRSPQEAFAAAHGDRRLVQPVGILAHDPYPRYYFSESVQRIAGRPDFVRKLASRRFGKTTAFVREEAFAVASGRVLGVRETANTATVSVETAGPAFLVISVTPHKYWRITIDGQDVPAQVTNIGYQGVIVPGPGRHTVAMRYRNPLFVTGGAISLVTLIALAFLSRRRPRTAPSSA